MDQQYNTMNQLDTEKQPLLDSEAGSPQEPEPTLAELQQSVFKAQRAYMKAWSRTTSGKWHRRIMWGVTGILLAFIGFCMIIILQDAMSEDPWLEPADPRVPLEAHIMSKCPDARDCLHDMILPAMQNVSHLVDFKLSYIGKETDEEEEVVCMHGPEECLGNVIELCAAKYYPNPKIYLGFTMCLSREYENIPQRTLVEDCALEHGISIDKLNSCATDDEGIVSTDMLKRSIERTQQANVTKSCTIRVAGEIRCVRDGGEWKDCDGGHEPQDLVRDIKSKYGPEEWY